MIIQHNMAAMLASSNVNINEKSNAKSAEKLSSGYRINRAADDAAGLTISEKMRWQIRGLDRASKNIEDGVSLIRVADGALNESHAVLQRMNELAVQAADDINTDVDRDAIQLEMDDLSEELTRIAETTSFNEQIYPLASDGVHSIQLPSVLSSATLNIINDSGADVTCKGVTYKNGETMILDDVLWINGNVSTNSWIGLHEALGGGFVRPIANNQITFSLKDLFQITTPFADGIFSYPTLSDVQVDENGYLYIMSSTVEVNSMGLSDRRYLQSPGRGLIAIDDENGTWKGTPLPEKCEAQNCLRLDTSKAAASDIKIQSGALANQSIDIPLVNATAARLGVGNLDVMTHTHASKAITTINNAITKVSEYRSTFGACQNRLEHAKANVDNIQYNTQNAESIIRDTDMAEEMVRNSTTSILAQVGQSVLAQESKAPQAVLKLLQ